MRTVEELIAEAESAPVTSAAGRRPVVLRPVVRWGRRKGIGTRCRLRPDQQDGAGSMVDDEAGGGAEAVGPEAGAIAVTGEDEQFG
ncbi:hypothetical protein J0670_35120, partial [Streptomyces sp. FH025]|nr:hypothetical protein [Streptomyces sp. FH025]